MEEENNNFAGNYMETHRKGGGEDMAPGTLVSWEQDGNEVTFRCNHGVVLKVNILEEGLVRFRYAPQNLFKRDFSYGMCGDFKPDAGCKVDVYDEAELIAIKTPLLRINIKKEGLLKKIYDRKTRKLIQEDIKGFHWEVNGENGENIVKMSHRNKKTHHYYGLGDKSCEIDLAHKRFSLWGSDTYGYGKDSDPLYKNIPFYISLNEGVSYGVFFDNTFKSHFDFGAEKKSYTSFFADGGEMNYYFIYENTPLEVAGKYAKMTGTPELPPLWALGYHQCKWSYFPEEKVREITSGFRDRKIPCDAIYLDIDYMDGYRCFTWDPERFPDPKGMVDDFEKDGFKTIVIIDPGLKIDSGYGVWAEGMEKDYYCRWIDGALFQGSVWPGLCHFPDFTRAEVRDWWAEQFKGLIEETGVRGVWNDMNEPAVFEEGTFPDNVMLDCDGDPGSHRKAHNVYGMQMVRATQEGLRRYGKGRRPFAITRSAYAGTQRYACGWTGDNVASWEHLRIANYQCQRLATSGMSFIGSDVGGFIETPTPEMYARWVQLAVFHPFFRTHSSGDHNEQEPWSFGKEAEDLARKAIELRYRLLPLIYTVFRQHIQTGIPMLRSLPLMAPEEKDTYWRGTEFGFGDHLYVIPMQRPESEKGMVIDGKLGRYLYLPDGHWNCYHTDTHYAETMKEIWVEAPQDRIPIMVRGGALLPHWPTQQYVGEIAAPETTLRGWHKVGEETSCWYEDDGDGESYKEGNYRYSTMKFLGTESSVEISREYEGDWKPNYETLKLELRALPWADQSTISCKVDGHQYLDHITIENGVITIILLANFTHIEISNG